MPWSTIRLEVTSRQIAAHQLECAEDDLEYERGLFTIKGTDRTMTVQDAALHAAKRTYRTGPGETSADRAA